MNHINMYGHIKLRFVSFPAQRRTIFDDLRGVGEALDESVCVEDKCEGLTVCYSTRTLTFFVSIPDKCLSLLSSSESSSHS